MAVTTDEFKIEVQWEQYVEPFAEKIKRIRDVIPEDMLTEMDALSSLTNQVRWKLGDLVNKVYRILQRTGNGDMMDACWFVSVQTGEFRKQNTLREYAGVAGFYNRSWRKVFRSDVLPFSHFLYARSLMGDYTADDGTVLPMWQVCLAYSLEFTEQHGFCTSEAKLREMFDNLSVPM